MFWRLFDTLPTRGALDLVPKESVVAWLAHLRQFHPTFPFRVASSHIPPDDNAKGKAIPSEDDAIGSMALVSHLITALPDKPDVTVALVGLPTVCGIRCFTIHHC